MKLLVIFSMVALVAAAPQLSQLSQLRAQRPSVLKAAVDKVAQILKFDSENDGLGKYRYEVEQSDDQRQQAQGELRNAGAENEYIAVQGSYSWVGPDGVTYTVNYVADDNGYQPVIEQGPGGAVPPQVLASLLGAGSG